MLILDDFLIDDLLLKVVRDDLYPGVGGGNKSRKAIEYEKEVLRVGANALVTTGGIQSNHCRAIALLAARRGWRCHIVYHGTRERYEREKGNALLVQMTGATVEFVETDRIGEAMDAAMERFRENGFVPYYVTGGGHDLPGGIAYVKAMQELKEACEGKNWIPEYIFLASGTGSTQSGILVGCELNGWKDTRVIGISVARKAERGREIIKEFTGKLSRYYNIFKDYTDSIFFDDSYLYGGYECFTPEMKRILDSSASQVGLILDTTYSGKAYSGMLDIIRKHGLEKSKLLFWHTGGLMNIQK